MPIIKIDERLNKSEEVAEFFLLLLDEFKVSFPKLSLLQILTGKFRPGMDDTAISNSVISRFNEIGIPSGPLENGQPNVMEAYTRVLVEEMVDAVRNDMRVDVAVDPGMVVTAAGASPSGPVTTTGANPAPHSATGLAS